MLKNIIDLTNCQTHSTCIHVTSKECHYILTVSDVRSVNADCIAIASNNVIKSPPQPLLILLLKGGLLPLIPSVFSVVLR